MNSDYIKIRSVLKDLVAPRDLQLRDLPDANLPLFLLAELGPDLVAFATINGKPEEDYKRALDIFKGLYAESGDAWADRDLTLVVCTSEHDPGLNAYWNRIELDRYFCRKFVVEITANVVNQLRRLPFIPLNPERVAGLARPLSVQTLLRRKHGLETWLADSLAIPGGQSPESIIKKSLTAKALPVFQNVEMESFVGSAIAQQPGVRLKNIHIENFRAYCEQDFDFQPDVIVLYGPNGLGKTSLFDSLDFLCTGGVARFDDRYSKNRQQQLAALTRLGSTQDKARVTATFSVNGSEFTVERSVSDYAKAKVNGKSTNRPNTLIRLANLPKNTKMDLRVENFVRLFRATHLFGQESASLTCDIHNESKLSEETVARMLALQDYVEAISKSEKVANEIAGKLEIESTRRSSTAETLRTKEIELQNMSTVALSLEAPEAIISKGGELAEEISSASNVNLEPYIEITPSVVQSWRSLLESELNHVRDLLAIAKDAEARFPRLQELATLLKNLNEKCESRKPELADARSLLETQQRNASEIEAKRNVLVEQQRTLATRADSIKWLLANVADYQRASLEMRTVDVDLQRARVESARLLANRERMTAEAKTIEDRTVEIREQIQSQEKEISSINSFLTVIGDWRAHLKRAAQLSEAITKTIEQAGRLENEVNDLTGQLQQARQVAANAQGVLRRAQQSQSELQTLLDSLSQYITNEVCPLCGTPHKNRADLLREIARQRGTNNETVNTALKEVEATKSLVETLEQRLETLRQAQVLITADLNSSVEERDGIASTIEQSADQALALGIVETDPDRCEQTAKARADVLADGLASAREELAAQSGLLQEGQRILAAQIQQTNDERENLVALEARHRAAANLVSQLQTKAANLSVDLASAEEGEQELNRLNEELVKIKSDLDANRDASDKARAEVNRTKSAIEHDEKQIRGLETQLSTARRDRQEIEQVYARLDLSPDVKAEEVGTFRMRLEERELALEKLRSRVIDFEIALDSAQTQAALVKMEDELGVLRRTEEEVTARISTLSSLRKYFDDIYDSLSNVQQTLLSDYVIKYGPLASKIQQRLRTVYGFGELRLRAEEGGIVVTVEHNGVQLAPSDYFSESQLQIVMLSLFLSAVLTQTWSSFGLILLDDPVTHFDDLNEYALLDVIRGLVDSAGIRHQFVLSTCEERLYRLMRQRFSKIKTDVAFYEFQSIGEKGPVVVRR
jgi:exonuclease SbcC